MRITRKLIEICLQGLLLTTLLISQMVSAETVMTPRDRAAFEAELQALNEKYGPKAGAMELAASSMDEADADARPSAEAASTSEPMATPVANAVQTPALEGEQAAQSALLSARANQQLTGASTTAAVSKLRIELSPNNAREFMFDGQSYTRRDLMPILQALKQKYAIDYVVLLQAGAEPVQLTHIVELAKISRELLTPAVYQDGKQLRAVDAR